MPGSQGDEDVRETAQGSKWKKAVAPWLSVPQVVQAGKNFYVMVESCLLRSHFGELSDTQGTI